PGHRQASVLVAVMVCLALITALIGAMAQRAILAARQCQFRQRAVQTRWLVEAGLERAVFQIQHDRAYAGETWQIPAAELGGPHTAEVSISFMTTESPATITVRARYPSEDPTAVQRTETFPYVPQEQ
ncbi:MAG TPA: hypothetical protein VIY86_14730, partial [Pirellulaceae bacterium]